LPEDKEGEKIHTCRECGEVIDLDDLCRDCGKCFPCCYCREELRYSI